MANSQKGVKMNENGADSEFPSLEELKSILIKILPKETPSEINNKSVTNVPFTYLY